jgi:hypothetical protein
MWMSKFVRSTPYKGRYGERRDRALEEWSKVRNTVTALATGSTEYMSVSTCFAHLNHKIC